MSNSPGADGRAADSPDTEHLLREALETLAGEVHPAPDAYRAAHGEWQRRERRRRLILASLIVAVFTLAVVLGLLVLNHAPTAPGPVVHQPPSP
ncbi:hypothetical protein [Embleya hyalina]|uniref:Uncharacterized protein n=1 Tax=Embleya hyalina TaxID=516124 RepID=A0A401YTK1_9ACTN|nr:hypothetical protein [Embleya hyalina]GCD97921.1 hypothetical protein EHYA_05621 [Embleya hyalina]